MGRERESEGSTAETARKRPERPWTAARTMEVLRRCPLAIAQRLVHCAIAVSTAVLDRVTKTMSVAQLLTNNLDNSKQNRSNLLSPAPLMNLFWANLRVQLHLHPLRSLDLLISPGTPLSVSKSCRFYSQQGIQTTRRHNFDCHPDVGLLLSLDRRVVCRDFHVTSFAQIT